MFPTLLALNYSLIITQAKLPANYDYEDKSGAPSGMAGFFRYTMSRRGSSNIDQICLRKALNPLRLFRELLKKCFNGSII